MNVQVTRKRGYLLAAVLLQVLSAALAVLLRVTACWLVHKDPLDLDALDTITRYACLAVVATFIGDLRYKAAVLAMGIIWSTWLALSLHYKI